MFSMFRAMAMKEFRDVRGIMLLILILYALQITGLPSIDWDWDSLWRQYGSGISYDFNGPYSMSMPFLDETAANGYWWIVVVTAVALGLRQTLSESARSTWLFLLHRPASRRWLIGMKLLVGLALYFIVGSAVILYHGWRSATPGVYPSPFFWWMTEPWWATLLDMTVVYFAVFLVGIRSARWHGTRLLPLAALFLLYYVLPESEQLVARLVVVLLTDAVLLRSIFFVAKNRDYA